MVRILKYNYLYMSTRRFQFPCVDMVGPGANSSYLWYVLCFCLKLAKCVLAPKKSLCTAEVRAESRKGLEKKNPLTPSIGKSRIIVQSVS